MKHAFDLPGVSCERCKSKLALTIETKGISITLLRVLCTSCDWQEDLLDRGTQVLDTGKKQLQDAAKQLSKTLLGLRTTLPKNRDEWTKVVTDPRHPFTATLLTGSVIVLMELSGFGIFMLVTWLLANLILNPVGWLLAPLIVAIAFTYRRHFRKAKLDELKQKMQELETQRDCGEMSTDEFEAARNKLFSDFFN